MKKWTQNESESKISKKLKTPKVKHAGPSTQKLVQKTTMTVVWGKRGSPRTPLLDKGARTDTNRQIAEKIRRQKKALFSSGRKKQ